MSEFCAEQASASSETPRPAAASLRERLIAELLAKRNQAGHWRGRLCDSDLATAVAVAALALATQRRSVHSRADDDTLIAGGVRALVRSQNGDDGWGDTERSRSNIATTVLAVAALKLADLPSGHAAQRRGRAYIDARGLVVAVKKRYGKDKTFAVPILATAAVAGVSDWKHVPGLPFELAAVPRAFYAAVRMPVVSYAVPALVAIGLSIEHHRPTWIPGLRSLRRRVVTRVLDVLASMQPASGGYLEAVPLTGFVALHLIAAGRGDHPVVGHALRFLRASVRQVDDDTPANDGKTATATKTHRCDWPIDSDLATFVTTLAVNAIQPDPHANLASDSELSADREPTKVVATERNHYHPGAAEEWHRTLDWLLSCQNRVTHPFTGSPPGGWGWTDLSGAVPDADDTPGALLANRSLGRCAGAFARAKQSR